MAKTSSSLLSFSLLALLVASILANVYIVRLADAQSPWSLSKITGFGEDIIGVDYDPIEDVLWVMTMVDVGSFTEGRMYAVNATTDAIITNSLVLNSTSSTDANIFDFACNYPSCYFTTSSSTGTTEPGKIYRADITTTTASVDLTKDDNTVAVSGGYILATRAGSFGGTTLVYSIHPGTTSSTTATMGLLDGLSVNMTALTPTSVTLRTTTNTNPIGSMSLAWSQQSAPDFDVVAYTQANGLFGIVYSMDSATKICETSALGSDGAASSGVVIDHVDYGSFYIGRDDGAINMYDITDCSLDGTITAADTGLANIIYDMSIVEIGDTKYLIARDSGTGGNISFMPWNGTGFGAYEFIINSAPASIQGTSGSGVVVNKHPSIGRVAHAFDAGKMFVPMTNTDRAVLVVDIGSGFEEEEEGGGYGNPAGGGSTSNGLTVDLVNAPDNFLTGIFTIDTEQANMIATGIVHGLFLIVPMIYMMSGAKRGGQTPQIPLFVWAILALMAGGICVALGWMPILFLFAEIVVIVAAFAFLVSRGVGIP